MEGRQTRETGWYDWLDAVMINPRAVYAILIALTLFASSRLFGEAHAAVPAPSVVPEPAVSSSTSSPTSRSASSSDASSGLSSDLSSGLSSSLSSGASSGVSSGVSTSQPAVPQPMTPQATTLHSAILQPAASQSSHTDLWAEMRARFQLTVANRNPIEQQARAVASSQASVQINLDHASRYLYYILQEVAARGMPAEVALIPFLESGFNPKSKNGFHSAGLWGLMPIAGKSLNMSANFFSDDRRDILLSTQAALDLLQALYAQFGDWRLALIAYNWGPGNVMSVVRRQQALKLPVDYDHLNLPRVIHAYVAKLLAWREIIADPERYKVTLPAVPFQPYFVEVAATHNIDIDVAADLAEISVADFLYLNPSFNKSLIPGTAGHKILLPATQVDVFMTNYLTHQERFSAWQTLIVSQAQRPEDIAKIHNVSVKQLYEMNPLARGAQIRAGSSILIPMPTTK